MQEFVCPEQLQASRDVQGVVAWKIEFKGVKVELTAPEFAKGDQQAGNWCRGSHLVVPYCCSVWDCG